MGDDLGTELIRSAGEVLAGLAAIVLLCAFVFFRLVPRGLRRRAGRAISAARSPQRPSTTVVPARAPPRRPEEHAPPQALQGPSTTLIPARALRHVWTVDGDTFDDRITGERYRLANIDAPETDERAACDAERRLGQRAKRAAIHLLREAREITAAPTGVIDQYGRTIASFQVDGRDLGELLIARGLAVPWNGKRAQWCGQDGEIARLARAKGDPSLCTRCCASRGQSYAR